MINATTTSQAIRLKKHQRNSIEKKSPFDIQLTPLGGRKRNDIEAFIKQGFAKAYDAKISITAPYLLSLSNGNFKAALGFRPGQDNLFLEQYLSSTIEQQGVFIENNVKRQEIVEVSHLFSNAKRFTIPLFMVTAVSLFYLNYKYMVFSGTETVVNLIANTGVPVTFICNAEQDKIQTSNDDWGSYYSSNPKIVSVSLAEVMSVIAKHPKYSKMFQSLEGQIAKVCQQYP